jgi:hypothetical protein
MIFVRCWLFLVCLVFGVTLTASQGLAWEFSMDSAFNYVYEYYGQQGNQGFLVRSTLTGAKERQERSA